MLLWLWYRLVATALIQALAWELPYAEGANPPPQKKTKSANFSPITNKEINSANNLNELRSIFFSRAFR